MEKSKGISAGFILGVVFVVLKLCGVIHWSWWLVTLPFWGVFAIVFLFLIVLNILIRR